MEDLQILVGTHQALLDLQDQAVQLVHRDLRFRLVPAAHRDPRVLLDQQDIPLEDPTFHFLRIHLQDNPLIIQIVLRNRQVDPQEGIQVLHLQLHRLYHQHLVVVIPLGDLVCRSQHRLEVDFQVQNRVKDSPETK